MNQRDRLMPVRTVLLWCAALVLSAGLLKAADGDTIRVRTVEFNDRGPNQAGTFLFPSKDNRYRKILMNYKLKCPEGRPCGEWDYLMYVYLNHPSGRMDSTLMPGPTFTVNGGTTASLSYFSTDRGWRYTPRFERFTVREQTLREGNLNAQGNPIDSIGFISASNTSAAPLYTGRAGNRVQYLWTGAELSAAGLMAGNITAMNLYQTKAGNGAQRLTIRIKPTALTALSESTVQNDGFTTVFERSMTFNANGTVAIPFTVPFAWDGSSGIIVDITQHNATGGGDAEFAFDTSVHTGLVPDLRTADYYALFDGSEYIVTNDKAAIKTGTVEARFMAADTNGQHYLVSNDRDAGEDYPGYHLYLNGGRLYGAIWRESDNRIMTISGGKVVPGRWYHAAMTFDGTALVLYLDGEEVGRATTGATTIKDPAYNLMIGVLAFEAPTYYRHKGGIDNVRIWNRVLPQSELRRRMYLPMDQFTDNSGLVAHYAMDEGSGLTITDAVAGRTGTFMAGRGIRRMYGGGEQFARLQTTDRRPWTMFEQGDYVSRTDSVLVVDSTLADPVTIVRYADAGNPGRATDTLVRWTSYYRYSYDARGKVTDSTLVQGDATLTLQYRPYYSEPFEVIERYELMRYITPYGNGLNLGDGFTWTMDITDFAPLLHDSVSITAYNPQEALELTFDMILGTPERDVIDLEPLWDGNPRFGDNPSIDEAFLTPRTYAVPAEAAGLKLRVIQTGHGFGGSQENCAEFCDKIHYVKVGGVQRYERHVWRDDCGLNPVYPQGGTWLYNRSNWCPGAEVTPFDYELTPFVTPGQNAVIDVDMEPYVYTGNPGNWPNYVFTGTLFTYGPMNFARDVSVEHIVRPTTEDIYRRQNPICGRPMIVVRNRGAETITSMEIEYGVRGGGRTTFMWSGSIPARGEQTIELLPYNDWDKATDEHLFEVWLKTPNGSADEYPVDNYAFSYFEPVPVYYSDLEIRLRTNNFAADQYEWTLKTSDGEVVASRANLADNTLYVDSLQLADGCYEFRLVNKLGYGLDFWAMRSQLGSGSVSFSSLGKSMRTFNPDFGSEVYHQFRVGPKPAIAVSVDTLQFGDVEIGGEKLMTVEVSPANTEPLVVDRLNVILPNRGFDIVSTEPNITSEPGGQSATLAPGEKLKITMAFRPTKQGAHAATLTIASNDERAGTVSVPMRGMGQTEVSVGESSERLPLYLFAAPSVVGDESTVSFAVDMPATVSATVAVVNSIGQDVLVLYNGPGGGDIQSVTFSARTLPAGVYYIVLRAGGATTAVPVTVVR